MSDTLYWNDLHMEQSVVPESHVNAGEHVRLIIDYRSQVIFMHNLFNTETNGGSGPWPMWLQTTAGKYKAGTQEFMSRIGSMIRHHGLVANLSLRENLLLPFLYQGDHTRLEQAIQEIDEVAEWLDIASFLDEQAGERITYTHALISLGRCLLSRPSIVVAQEVHMGMNPDHLERFRELSISALQQLGSGLLYLTDSPNEGSGLEFARTLSLGPVATGSNPAAG